MSPLPPAFKSDAGKASPTPAPVNKLPPLASPAGKPAAQSATATALQAAVPVTAEGVMQRLRYFENLAEQHESYIEQLKAALSRVGAAVPVAYFAPLTGIGGSHSPKSG